MVEEREGEKALVERAKVDPAAFGLLYEKYVEKIYNYVYYRVGDHRDAEDLTAKTFYRALSNIDSFEWRGVPFSAWLYRIAHNLVANWYRRRSHHKMIPLDKLSLRGEGRANPAYLSEANEEKKALLAAIRHLNPDRQQLLILKFVGGITNAEIGQVMGRSEAAVKSLYHRTLISLRKEMKEE